ncbi:MAG TPA: hypothetical protein VJN29_13475 [Intrasporangium sp.]|uniref:DUF7144 family membrane protein n=1 Tax=Intrasporangium sp. TaxID=1925024 RepID=UPI002B45D9D3|nr:hypothetical protein [Intrasporangium sp.]HKX68223.1 hypothetical protein [Intrasporangium sp.]
MSSQTSPTKLAWTEGLSVFAAALLIMVGIFQALQGLAAIINDQRFVVTGDYVYKFDITGWGWIHLILGLVAIGVGTAMIMGQTWSYIAAMVFAILSAVAQFMWLPYYPIWAIVIIALNVAIIWALVEQVGTRRTA